jgi:hypothetical protein
MNHGVDPGHFLRRSERTMSRPDCELLHQQVNVAFLLDSFAVRGLVVWGGDRIAFGVQRDNGPGDPARGIDVVFGVVARSVCPGISFFNLGPP